MGQYVQQVPVRFMSYPVTTAAIVYVDTMGFPFPLTVTAIPGAGGTLLVEASTTAYAAGKTTAATWIPWTHAAVGSVAQASVISPVAALRFTAVGAEDGIIEVNG